MIFNSPLVFRIPFNLFQPSTSIVSTTTTFFFKIPPCTKVQNKNPLVSIWTFLSGKKKSNGTCQTKLPNLFESARPAYKKASLQNDITFFKVNFNVTKNKNIVYLQNCCVATNTLAFKNTLKVAKKNF